MISIFSIKKRQSFLTDVNYISKLLMKTKALALMGAASFCAGVRHKRYSGQQEIAP